jgi:glycosyltransferase involved in cell wall biosynthesis
MIQSDPKKEYVEDITLIVDDSSTYRAIEGEMRGSLAGKGTVRFYYSDYENSLIRFFHKTPIIGNAMSHVTFWMLSLITAIKISILHRERKKLFINPIVGLFYCALSRVLARDEYIGLAGLLFVHKDSSLYLKMRKRFTEFCCGKATIIFVYSRGELAEYSMIFPAIASKLRFVRYGRNYEVFGNKGFSDGTDYVASGGISNRDFNTLAEALSLLSLEGFPVNCKIATRIGHEPIRKVPPGMEVRYDIRIDQFGDFLKNSRLVVLPLKQTQLSSGHMVLLEAMSIGKPVIVADTPAVRDYVSPDTVILYEPENPIDLAGRIRYAIDGLEKDEVTVRARRAHSLFWSTYTHANLIDRLLGALLDEIQQGDIEN